MKNTENAAIPMSAIDRRVFRPRRLSAKPPQVSRTNPSKSVRTATGSLNQKVRRSGSEKILKNRPHRHNENCCGRVPPVAGSGRAPPRRAGDGGHPCVRSTRGLAEKAEDLPLSV